MQSYFFEASPLAIAYFSALLFLGNSDKIRAVTIAVAVHEVSHLLALSFFNCRIFSVKLRLNGLCIGYTGNDRPFEVIFSDLAGPLGGLLFFLLGKLCTDCILPEWLLMSCRISLFLSIFNLLPVYPLDGGNAVKTFLESLSEKNEKEQIIKCFGAVFAVGLIFWGLFCMMINSGFGISLAGIWILCANISTDDL